LPVFRNWPANFPGVMMKQLITTWVLCLTAIAVQADDISRHASIKAPDLRSELLRRTNVDQDARTAMIKWSSKRGLKDDSQSAEEKAEFKALSAAIRTADKENTSWLKQVVENRGWPTRTLVGQDGASAAWLLVQHADAEPKFQRKCLDLMAKLPREEVSQQNVAYLTDRVLLAEGKKQLYGTQFMTVNGKLRPRPLEDEPNVDKLRAGVGLPSLASSAAEMAKAYGGGTK
jgi:hypothetical protein